jgi:hypothetical protein
MSDVRPREPVQLREFLDEFKFARKYRAKLRTLIEPELHRREGVDRRKVTTEVIDLLGQAVRGLKQVDHIERNRATPAQKALTATAFLSDGTLLKSGEIDEDTEETIVATAEEILFSETGAVPFRPNVIHELRVSKKLRVQVHAKLVEQVSDGRPATESGPLFAAKVAEILFRAGMQPTASAARSIAAGPSNLFKRPRKTLSTGESAYLRILAVLFEAAGYLNVGTLSGFASEGLKLARLEALAENSRDSKITPNDIHPLEAFNFRYAKQSLTHISPRKPGTGCKEEHEQRNYHPPRRPTD